MGNLQLVKKRDVSSFRKIAIGTWEWTRDPQVYGTLQIRMEEAMRYVAEFRAKTGRRLTLSHMMAKAVAAAFVEVPDANAILRWNRIYLRKDIGVFFQVVMDDEGKDKIDLSGATVYDVDKKTLVEICDDFQAKVDRVRKRKDPALEKTRKSFLNIPYFMLNRVIKILSYFTSTLNLDLSWAGIPRDPFGSVMVTNIGTLGLETAYVPLVPYSRVPMVLAMGAVKDEPVIENGQVAAGKVMRVHATFDHRIIDGFHAAVMSRVLRSFFERPYEHFGAIEEVPALPSPEPA